MLNVVLFEPEIPPNTGNIGRLCYGAGAALHLIEPLGFSLDDKSLKRAGLDYWPELNPTLWPDFETFLKSVPKSANCFYLTTKSTKPYWDATFTDGDYLIFGPETRGLPGSLLTGVEDQIFVIPQERGRSLNLATSAGIVLYEAIRQLKISNF